MKHALILCIALAAVGADESVPKEPAVIEITRQLKALFDPQNILNPGKIVA